MQVLGIDRIVLMSHDFTEAAERLNDLLGIDFGTPFEIDGDKAVISRDNSRIEIGSPEGKGMLADHAQRFLDSRGPGMYGLALRVADVEAAREELLEKDIEPIYTIERFQFKEYYYHHDHFGGVMIALTEFPHGVETNVLAGEHESRSE